MNRHLLKVKSDLPIYVMDFLILFKLEIFGGMLCISYLPQYSVYSIYFIIL